MSTSLDVLTVAIDASYSSLTPMYSHLLMSKMQVHCFSFSGEKNICCFFFTIKCFMNLHQPRTLQVNAAGARISALTPSPDFQCDLAFLTQMPG